MPAPGPRPDDAYQDAWAHLLVQLPRYTPGGAASLETWSSRVVHRRLIDRHRRRSVRRIVQPVEHEVIEGTAGGGSPEARVGRQRRIRALEGALVRLPDAQRRVVVLHHLQGVSLAEIAEDEGVAVGTVKSRLSRARARLAELMGGGAS